MADLRYLRERRKGRWSVRIPVPVDLQERLGKTIEKALGTSDLREAQRLRWDHAAAAQQTFARLRQQRHVITSAEIEREAQRTYRTLLDEANEALKDGRPVADGDIETDPATDVPRWPNRELAGLAWRLEALEEDLQGDRGWPEAIEEQAAEFLRRHGADFDAGGRPEVPPALLKELCDSLLRARIEATQAIMAVRQGQLYSPPDGPFNVALSPWERVPPVSRPARRPTRRNDGVRFQDAADQFVKDRQRDKGAAWTKQTQFQAEAVFRLFNDFADNPPLEDITRATAAEYLATISQLKPDYGRSPKTKGSSLWKLLEDHKAGEGEPGLSNKTLNRHASTLRGMWQWAVRQGFVSEELSNPFRDLARPVGQHRRTEWLPFTTDELHALFGAQLWTDRKPEDRIKPAKHTPQTALTWAPLVGLFSGMRIGEIASLRVSHVVTDGIPYFNITEFEGSTVKTAAAVRRVPIHDELIRCGFLEYVRHVADQGHAQVFPGLTPQGPDGKLSWYLTKAFGNLRRDIGLTRPRTSFHSFRKNFASELERARVHQSEIAQLLGHERGFTLSTYAPLGLDLKSLQRLVRLVRYPGLKIDHLYVTKPKRAPRKKAPAAR